MLLIRLYLEFNGIKGLCELIFITYCEHMKDEHEVIRIYYTLTSCGSTSATVKLSIQNVMAIKRPIIGETLKVQALNWEYVDSCAAIATNQHNLKTLMRCNQN